MKILNAGCPRADGFYMPAEYAPHNSTIIIWPKRPGSWIYGARRAREAFAEVICAIAESEQAYVLAEADVIDNARSVVEAVRKQKNYPENFPDPWMNGKVRREGLKPGKLWQLLP